MQLRLYAIFVLQGSNTKYLLHCSVCKEIQREKHFSKIRWEKEIVATTLFGNMREAQHQIQYGTLFKRLRQLKV